MNTLTIATLAFAAIGIVAQATSVSAQTKPIGHYADVNGIHLYYEIHGTGSTNGAPLVLLHGGLMSSSLWGPTLPALAAGREVIAVDLQGHGHTADIDRPMSVQAMGDDIA